MCNKQFNLVDSTLTVKASGSISDISNDLDLPEGKSIAELLDDQKKIQQDKH